MRLGTSSPLKHNSPEEWAENQVKLGCRTVVFPLCCNDDEQKIIAYKEAAEKAGLTIAEVGIWRNALAGDADERQRNMDYCVNSNNGKPPAPHTSSNTLSIHSFLPSLCTPNKTCAHYWWHILEYRV